MKHCDQCNISFVSIGGISGLVHERGCPNTPADCQECGAEFVRANPACRVCDDCRSDYWADADDAITTED